MSVNDRVLKGRPGFTLIELLVVITVIGIIAAAILASQSTARHQARAAQILQQFQEIETAFKLYMVQNDEVRWPDGGGSSTGDTWHVNTLATPGDDKFPGLHKHFSQIPDPPGAGAYAYYSQRDYDCFVVNSFNTGVNIRIEGTDAAVYDEIFEVLDENVDGGDGPGCGRIKYGGSSDTLYYLIGEDENDI